MGLERVKGKWVSVVDADDVYDKDTFSILDQYIKQEGVDYFCFRVGIYNKNTGELIHEQTNNRMETAWMTKELVFRSEPLRNVFNCLARKFAVTFNVNDEKLLNDIYTGTFEDENIESIMRVLKIHYKFNYKNEDSMITINTRK